MESEGGVLRLLLIAEFAKASLTHTHARARTHAHVTYLCTHSHACPRICERHRDTDISSTCGQ